MENQNLNPKRAADGTWTINNLGVPTSVAQQLEREWREGRDLHPMLCALLKKELIKMAKEYGLKNYSKLIKNNLISLLHDAILAERAAAPWPPVTISELGPEEHFKGKIEVPRAPVVQQKTKRYHRASANSDDSAKRRAMNPAWLVKKMGIRSVNNKWAGGYGKPLVIGNNGYPVKGYLLVKNDNTVACDPKGSPIIWEKTMGKNLGNRRLNCDAWSEDARTEYERIAWIMFTRQSLTDEPNYVPVPNFRDIGEVFHESRGTEALKEEDLDKLMAKEMEDHQRDWSQEEKQPSHRENKRLKLIARDDRNEEGWANE